MAGPTSSDEDSPPESKRGNQRRPTKALPTDRITFGRQLDLLRAYAAKSGPEGTQVTNKDVAEILGMSHSTASLANAFFTEVGLLTRGDSGLVPVEAVREFAREHEWDPDSASHRLAAVLGGSWCWKALEPNLALGVIDEKQAVSRLAHACSAGPKYERQLRIVLEYLGAAGLVEREAGMVQRGVSSRPEPAAAKAASTPETPVAPSAPTPKAMFGGGAPEEGVIEFSVSIRVKTEEIAGWSAERISAFFSGFAQVLAAKGAMGTSEEEP